MGLVVAHSRTCRRQRTGHDPCTASAQEVVDQMTVPIPPTGIDDPDLPEPAPDPEPDPEPGGPVREVSNPPLSAPGPDGPPMRLPRDNPDVETEI